MAHPYLARLNNKRLRSSDASPLPSTARSESRVRARSESRCVAARCSNAYLRHLNQRRVNQEAWIVSGGSASGESQASLAPPSVAQAAQPAAQPAASRRLLPRLLKGMTLHDKLGSGGFGSVFKCTWKEVELAVEIYHAGAGGKRDAERELMLLKHAGAKPKSKFICNLQA